MRTRSLLQYVLPVALCGASLGMAALLNGGLEDGPTIQAFVEGDPQHVAALEQGRVQEVLVTSGQLVVPGQLLVKLDATLLEAELEVLRAEESAMLSQIRSSLTEAQRQQVMDRRTLLQSVDQARVELSQAEAALASATARWEILRTERARLQKLVQEKLATADELTQVELDFSEVDKTLQDQPRHIELLRTRVQELTRLSDAVPAGYASAASHPLEGALEVLRRRIQLLETRREGYLLRAPVAAQVGQVQRRAGEVVQSGESILTLVPQKLSQAVACVGERDALQVKVGDTATLWERGSSRVIKAQAVALGPLVEELPLRCRRSHAVPVWGRMVTLSLGASTSLLAGTAFDVSFDPLESRVGASSLPPPSSVGAEGARVSGLQLNTAELGLGTVQAETLGVTPSTQPQLMGLEGLDLRRFNLEPSGVVWMASLGRYVVISDDPGAQKGAKHLPVLFLMDAQGKIDAQPIPVEGVRTLNDLEGIAVSPQQRLYVCSSLSLNKDGELKADRGLLLALERVGNRLQVVGQVSLRSMLEGLSPAQQVALGLENGLEGLNVEGLTWHENSLYLGLKAPLAAGEALIWKLEHPDTLLEQGRLDGAGLSLWARVKLEAQVDDAPVPAGIAELLFAADGSLLLSATPTVNRPGKTSGTLWKVSAEALQDRSKRLQAARVHTFEGYKPEGLSLSAHPGRLTVVFDTGGTSPAWQDMLWP